MKEYEYRRVRFAQLKLIIAVLCLIGVIITLSEGIRTLTSSSTLYETVSGNHYDSLTSQTSINASVQEILDYCNFGYDKEVSLRVRGYLVRTFEDNLIVVEVEQGSGMDEKMMELYQNGGDPVLFRGKVVLLHGDQRITAVDRIEQQNLMIKEHITGKLLDTMIQAIEYDEGVKKKLIIAYFSLSAILLVLAYFIGRNSMRNLIFQIQLKRGKVALKPQVRKEDLYLINEEKRPENTLEDTFYDGSQVQESEIQGASSEEDDGKPPVGKMYFSDAEYYESTVNQDGNFYVDSHNKSDKDSGKWNY